LQADRNTIKADGQDLSFVTVTIVDKDGLPVPRSRNRIHFDLNGPGEIVATDNGDATSFESFQSHEHNAFNGLCLAIIRTKAGETGKITLRGYIRRSGGRGDSSHGRAGSLTLFFL